MKYFLLLIFLMGCVISGVGRADDASNRCEGFKALAAQLDSQIAEAFDHGVKAEPLAVKFFESGALSPEESDDLFSEALALDTKLDPVVSTVLAINELVPSGNSVKAQALSQALHVAVGIVIGPDAKLTFFRKWNLEYPLLNTASCDPEKDGKEGFAACQAKIVTPIYVQKAKDGSRKMPFQAFKSQVSQDISGMVAAFTQGLCKSTNP